MTRSDIERKALAIIRKEKELPEDAIHPDTLLADAGIDSLDALTILFSIEEEFGIAIPDGDARSMKTFNDMIGAIERQLPQTA